MTTVRLSPGGVTLEMGDEVYMFPCKGILISRKIMDRTSVIGYKEEGAIVFHDVVVSWAEVKDENGPGIITNPMDPKIDKVMVHCSSQDMLPPFAWIMK